MPCIAKDHTLEEQTRENGDPLSGEQAEENVARDHVNCPSCGYSFITNSNGKKKLRTRILVFVKNGNAMGICPRCKANLKVPVSVGDLRPPGMRGPAPTATGQLRKAGR